MGIPADRDQDGEWQDDGFAAVQRFAGSLRDLHNRNPWPSIPVLPQSLVYLMTELWDRGFTQTQIRNALIAALDELPKYTGGEEIRP
jgi:hypothetical protein